MVLVDYFQALSCRAASTDIPDPLSPLIPIVREGARGVVVIVVGNGHCDTSSNPGRD